MKKNLLLLMVLFSTSFFLKAQVTLHSQDFETGTSGWAINTGSGTNEWVRNNAYSGDWMGIPLITNTPDQPATITGFPNSYYLHITDNSFLCPVYSVCNANFSSGTAATRYSTMSSDVSSVGFTVTFSFYYLCVGDATSYGTVEYSTNSGSSWTPLGSHLFNQATWTQLNLTNAALDNQATLRFRFSFVTGTAGNDPAFSVDQILITGMPTASVTTSALASNVICAGTNVSVPFTLSGTFTSPNNFNAQLSNASGSFASPTLIGTLVGTTAGNVNAAIPVGTPAGTGYRIRVNSTVPVVTGANNGTDITINAAPTITAGVSTATLCAGIATTLTSGGGSTYSWAPTTSLNDAASQNPISTGLATTTYTVTGTSGGCTNTNTITVTRNQGPAVMLPAFTPSTHCKSDAAFALSGGIPTGGIYSGPGVSGGTFNPSAANTGINNIVYSVTGANTCVNSDTSTITVNSCSVGIENVSGDGGIRVFPNPSHGIITIDFSGDAFDGKKFMICDLLGQISYSGAIKNQNGERTHTLQLPKGIYFIRLEGTINKGLKVVVL